jgi:hypothetical protein
MLLLTMGAFTGAYPLMYFAQEFVALELAIATSAVLVLLIIAVRVLTIMPKTLAIFGFVIPAAAIMTLTLLSVLYPSLQGVILTGGAIGLFVVAMVLIPQIRIEPMLRHRPGPAPLPAQ